MKTNSVLQVRIDADIRKQAEELFERLGITTADAVRMFIMQSLEIQGLPFEVKRRNLYAFGVASEYADTSKIPKEKTAWAEAVAKKYSKSEKPAGGK